MKKESLLRELAERLSKCSLADFRDALDILRKGDEQRESARRARQKLGTPRNAKKQSAQKGQRKLKQTPHASSSGDRSKVGAVARRKPAKRLRRLKTERRATYKRLRGQRSIRPMKNPAIDATMSMTASHSKQSLSSDLKGIRADFNLRSSDYAKWFNMIFGREVDRKLDMVSNVRGVSEDLANIVDETDATTREGLDADINRLLLGGPFKLIHDPDNNLSRAVTFLPGGGLKVGRTQSENSWRISQGRLELLDQAGSVYSRFALAKDRRSLYLTSEPDHPSAKNQRLIRISAKR